MKTRPDQPFSVDDALETLTQLAFLANDLAKQLKGTPYRAVAYKMKATALSSLVVNAAATPNGFDLDGTVGLDLVHGRLHCPVSALTPKARTLVHRKRASAPCVRSFSECLTAEQRQALAAHFVPKRAA
jgi:hypothetical protein